MNCLATIYTPLTSVFVSLWPFYSPLGRAATRSASHTRGAHMERDSDMVQREQPSYQQGFTLSNFTPSPSRSPPLTMSTPKDHQSAVMPCPRRLTTSGAMYSTVPQKEKVFLESSSMDSLLRPKSVSLMWPSASSRILCRGRGRRGGRGEVGNGRENTVWLIHGAHTACTPFREGAHTKG